MTIEELSRAWNELRTAALGRSGLETHVSPALAQRIRQAYERYHAAVKDAPILADVAPSVSASRWVELYRELAAEVAREGRPVPPDTLPTTAAEAVADTARAVGTGGLSALWALAVVALAYVVYERGSR